MRVSVTNNGMTVRAIAGAHSVLLGIDLDEKHREGCLGFSIQRKVKSTGETRYLPNSITFPGADPTKAITTETAPLQKFRWGDHAATPGETYWYTVTARYGKPGALTDGPTATIEVTTENPSASRTAAVFFNRGAAASQAYNAKFGQLPPDQLPPDKQKEALAWLSRGLEEAILDYLGQAKDSSYALHAAIYEFQKPNLLAGLKAAVDRGAEVQVVYHYRHKGDGKKDHTWTENEEAAKAAGLTPYCTQRTQDPGVIMHNKFVVLLQKSGDAYVPQAVWTGSTNWTEGGIYGQLNVGHAVYDPDVAQTYESYFQLLKQDLPAAQMKAAVAKLSPVPGEIPKGVVPILSPQQDTRMLDLYGEIAQRAKCLLVSAPFELAPQITKAFEQVPPGTVHYLLLDKESSLGNKSEIDVIEHAKGNEIGFAAPLDSVLTSFQSRLLEKSAPEHYHHPGIHIHSKIILADPFGDDPILVTGSANFSNNSTVHNDSNSLLIRGDKAVTDIYATDFMRMFEHYHFRAAAKKQAAKETDPTKKVITLTVDDSWTHPYYEEGSSKALDRMLFAGTLPASDPPAAPAAPAKQTITAKKPAAAEKKKASPAKDPKAGSKRTATGAGKKKKAASKGAVKRSPAKKRSPVKTRKKASSAKERGASAKKTPARKSGKGARARQAKKPRR